MSTLATVMMSKLTTLVPISSSHVSFISTIGQTSPSRLERSAVEHAHPAALVGSRLTTVSNRASEAAPPCPLPPPPPSPLFLLLGHSYPGHFQTPTPSHPFPIFLFCCCKHFGLDNSRPHFISNKFMKTLIGEPLKPKALGFILVFHLDYQKDRKIER